MPVAMGISCGKCGRVYFVAHQDNARRIRFDNTDKIRPSYQLTCDCSAVYFFEKREMLPYSVSAYCIQRGYAERGDHLQIPPVINRSKMRAA
jgi:hypothetical protein